MYEERTYRSVLNAERFHYFSAIHKETDLLVGYSKGPEEAVIQQEVLDKSRNLRIQLEKYLVHDPGFGKSLEPVQMTDAMEENIKELVQAGSIANTGPMAAVAGYFSEKTGRYIYDRHQLEEVVVENGGDIFCIVKETLTTRVYAGKSSLSNKIAVKLPPGQWGICTSSGTVGHSFSMGKADAVTVVSKSTPVADAFATAICNKIQSPANVESVLNDYADHPWIEGVLVIIDDILGAQGRIEIAGI